MRLERSVACISVSIHYEMVNLMVAVNTKRKDSEVAGHGFSIFLDPKRAKLQVWSPVRRLLVSTSF
jgi:hypothetical protein